MNYVKRKLGIFFIGIGGILLANFNKVISDKVWLMISGYPSPVISFLFTFIDGICILGTIISLIAIIILIIDSIRDLIKS